MVVSSSSYSKRKLLILRKSRGMFFKSRRENSVYVDPKIHILLMSFTNYVVFTSKNNKVKTTTHAMTYILLSIFFYVQ